MRAAVVGLGWWGKVIVKNLAKSKKINVVCGVDQDLSQLKEFGVEYNIELRNSYASVLSDASIDSVILATPNRLHHTHIIDAAEAGKFIFCEKPLCLTSENAREAIRSCKENGIVLGLGHERRFEPAMKSLFDHVARGDIGRVLHVETNFSHDLFDNLSKDNWRFNPKDAPGGGFTARGIHLTDFMVHMFGGAKRVYSTMSSIAYEKPRIDTMSANIEFSNGITGIVSVSIATPFYGRYTVFGDKGWIEAREINNFEHDDPGELVFCKQGGERIITTHPHTNTVLENFELWHDACFNSQDYPITSEEMVANIEIFEAIVKSGEMGEIVDI
tara:strand:+ start:3302 stop:4291 length:990 start_codon:yes stop_codon:yes gene_type:complete